MIELVLVGSVGLGLGLVLKGLGSGLGLGFYAVHSGTEVECWTFGRKCQLIALWTRLRVRFA